MSGENTRRVSQKVLDQPEISHERGSRKWWVLIAIGIGTFMSALDGSVVNTILPVLRQSFSSTVANVEWIVTIYLLILSGLLLSFGRLGDLRGHKTVYLAGFGIFITSSALCGLSSSIPILIIFRGIQALGAAMLQANSPAILTSNFSASQRGQALGLQATMTYLGLTVGPSLGGWLNDQFSWRAVFYINIPVGITAFLLSLWFIVPDSIHENKDRFDFLGAFLFVSGLVLLILGLNQAHIYGWSSLPIIAMLILSLAILGFFIYYERKSKSPMLDLSLFSNKIFASSVTSAILNYIGVYGIVFLMPFFLIQGLGLMPARAGIILTVMPVVMAIVAPISGSISDRIGTRIPATSGMIVLTAGLILLSGLQADSSIKDIALRLAVAGLGIGTFIAPNTSALMGAAARSRQGIASGILATSRNVGMVLGVGLAGAVFTTILGPEINPPSDQVISAIKASFILASFFSGIGIFVALFRPKDKPTNH